jgi:hypothetical protein
MIKNLLNLPMLWYIISSTCKTSGSMIIMMTASFTTLTSSSI